MGHFSKRVLFALLAAVSVASAQVTSFAIRPSATDPDIRGFDEPHWVYVNRDILVGHRTDLPQDRHELFLWLTGTGGKAHEAQGFLNLAASLGYRVVSLMYPDDTPATVCSYDTNPNAFEAFRMAIIQGGTAPIRQGRQALSVDRADSIDSRLLRLLQRLSQIRPREEWGQFINSDGTLKWETIAVGGQSQGGGHAALIGIKHPVARVLCFGAPKDFSVRLNSPAAWYGETSATPKNRFFAFNHVQDPKGCTPQQLLANLRALGLGAFGSPEQVDTDAFPFRHSRILYTAYPAVTVSGEESEGAKTAHGSAISTLNAERWRQVWTYMLTEHAP